MSYRAELVAHFWHTERHNGKALQNRPRPPTRRIPSTSSPKSHRPSRRSSTPPVPAFWKMPLPISVLHITCLNTIRPVETLPLQTSNPGGVESILRRKLHIICAQTGVLHLGPRLVTLLKLLPSKASLIKYDGPHAPANCQTCFPSPGLARERKTQCYT